MHFWLPHLANFSSRRDAQSSVARDRASGRQSDEQRRGRWSQLAGPSHASLLFAPFSFRPLKSSSSLSPARSLARETIWPRERFPFAAAAAATAAAVQVYFKRRNNASGAPSVELYCELASLPTGRPLWRARKRCKLRPPEGRTACAAVGPMIESGWLAGWLAGG